MADKLRRAKDIIKKNVTSYLNATTNSKYLLYFEGSPTYITYYQLDSLASLTDVGLENVNSLIGKNTPKKYKRIFEVPIYGVDALDVSNELSERGLEARVNGEFMMLPNTVRPYSGDFFIFEYEGLETHLFRIDDVQYDKITAEKFFRCTYSLYPYNTEEIFENVSDDYTCIQNEDTLGVDSGNTISIVKNSTLAAQEASQNLIDGIIEKYKSLFYNEDSDTFSCYNIDEVGSNGEGSFYWSPYLQHFLYETKALTPYNEKVMSEIYINDISEGEFPTIYNELTYRNSIFRNIQIKNKDINFSSNFISISDYNLKCNRNLPFFMCPYNFKLVSPINTNKTNSIPYSNAKLLLYFNEANFKDVDHYHKVHKMDNIHIGRLAEYLKDNDIVYECINHEMEPSGIYRISKENTYNVKWKDISIQSFINSNETSGSVIFDIIRDYLNDNFKLTEDILETLNSLYYGPSVENYICMPLLLFILKDSMPES